MTFTHDPLTDAAADAELREQLRAPNCRPLRLGGLRQMAIAKTLMGIGAVVGLIAGFSDAVSLMVLAGLIAIGGVVWSVIVALHDEQAENARDNIAAALAVPPNHDLKYLLEMKEKYHEIDGALRAWKTKGLTVRARDVWAVRAWVNKTEPVRQRERLLRQLES